MHCIYGKTWISSRPSYPPTPPHTHTHTNAHPSRAVTGTSRAKHRVPSEACCPEMQTMEILSSNSVQLHSCPHRLLVVAHMYKILAWDLKLYGQVGLHWKGIFIFKRAMEISLTSHLESVWGFKKICFFTSWIVFYIWNQHTSQVQHYTIPKPTSPDPDCRTLLQK